jgi:hypothetical protein
MLDLLLWVALAGVVVLALLRKLLNVIAGVVLVGAALVAVLLVWALLPGYDMLVVLPVWWWV